MAITFVNKVLTVDRSEFELTLWRRSLIGHEFKKEKVYPVAVGKAGYTTPARVYLINSRSRSPSWLMPDADWVQPPEIRGTILPAGDPNNPIKARWLGVTDPLHGIGIHGTDDDASIGSAASHGCIRMHIPDVIELFDLVKARTPIHIHGG